VARFDPHHLWPQERAARSHLVGVVLPSLTNPFYVELLEGAQAAARRTDTLLAVATTHDDQAIALRAIAQLAAKGVDGVVVVSHDISNLLGDDGGVGGSRRLPFVVVDRPGAIGHSVEADLEGAGRLAAGHLAADGHRMIGLITVEPPLSNVLPIETGVRHALADAGLALEDRHVVRADGWDLAAGARATARLLDRPGRPTALVAIADLLAIGAMQELRRRGLQVPADVAIVGIDDIPLAALVDPGLTSVALPARAMGAEALATLESAWLGELPTPRRVVLGVDLVVRESCGPHASPPRSSTHVELRGRP
jgi:LacI family transcriptional regulator